MKNRLIFSLEMRERENGCDDDKNCLTDGRCCDCSRLTARLGLSRRNAFVYGNKGQGQTRTHTHTQAGIKTGLGNVVKARTRQKNARV